MKRLFFAVDIPQALKYSIESWRQQQISGATRPVATGNLHLTLAFIGQVATELQPVVEQIGERIKTRQFDMVLNKIDYFSKPKVLWLGTDSVPEALNEMAQTIQHQLRARQFNIEKRTFKPHISLFRNTKIEDVIVGTSPNLRFKPVSFSLYQSFSTAEGVCYQPVRTWKI